MATLPAPIATDAASAPAVAVVAVPSPPSSSVSAVCVSDDDALFLHATRKYLQDKLIENAKQSFLQLSQLETPTTRFTHLDAVLRDFYTAGIYDIQVLLSFLEALPNWQWTLDGCVILHRVDEVLRTPSNQNAALRMPTLPLAFFLHKLISHLEGAVKVRAESYWYEWVSPTIRAIVMGQEIVMESVMRKEVVYAPISDFSFDGDRRNVFSWRKEWTPDNQKERWRLIPANAQKDRFYIQSVPYEEYLYAADYAKFRRDDHGNVRSRVFLWRKRNEPPGESGHWQLITLDHENRDVFALYNPYQKEFLYSPADVYDGDRRHVLTTRSRLNDPMWLEERKWSLYPATFSAIEQGIEAFFVKKYPTAVEKLTQALAELPDHTEHVKCFAYRMTANLRMGHFDKIQDDFSAIEALGGDKAAIFHGLAHLWEENAAFLEQQVEHKHAANPFFMQHQAARGDFFFVRKQFDVAVGFYHEVAMAQISPSSTSKGNNESEEEDEDVDTKRRRGIAYLGCGKCFYSLNEIENACHYLSIGLGIHGLPLDIEALLLLWMGKCKRKQKEYEEALQFFEKAFDRASAAANATSLPSVTSLKQTILMDMKVVSILKQDLYSPLLSKCDDGTMTNTNGSAGGRADGDKTLQQMMDLFQCPLSLELMQDPVMTPNGDTYEREMIERHLEVNGHFDPLTRAPLVKEQLYPNRALKLLMETMLSDHRLGLLLASCST
uniref:E3 ubiquitin-protein ligase CHIP n=1 Tax=Globisporangium ultimum (strain ATCC 200006 / CBS 805.95 / DAOM BR144) TaxID=431595 RepID=K3X9D0_GLOUD